VITTNAPGTYAVTVSAGSCVGTGSMVLTVEPSPTPVLSDTLICSGINVTLNPQAAPTDSVFWYLNGALIATSPTLDVNAAGAYVSTLQTANGCRNSDTSNVTVELPLPAPSVDCGSGTTANYKYVYTWNSIPGATGYEVSLDGGVTWQPVQPDTLYPSTVSITDFRVRAVNSNGVCRDGNISELAPCEVIIPNIITPNGDNINDIFYIKNLDGHPNSTLKILSRWGNIVFDSSNYRNDWDGNDLADGTYYYVLKLDDGKEFTGTITILNGK
jgi:gliding motility-associated-like protein